MDTKKVGAELRRFREMKGLDQVDIAAALGYKSSTSISTLESGDHKTRVPYVVYIDKIKNVYGKDFNYLLDNVEIDEADVVSFPDVSALMQIIGYDKKLLFQLMEIAKALKEKPP